MIDRRPSRRPPERVLRFGGDRVGGDATPPRVLPAARRLGPPALAILLACSGSPGAGTGPGEALPPPVTAAGNTVAAPETTPDAAASSDLPAAEPLSAPEPEPPPPPCSHVPGVCCVAVQPLGDVPQNLTEAARDGLVELYGFDVRVLDPVDLPSAAWYAPRSRYRAEKLLDFLEGRLPEGCDRIAGITTRDISTTKGDIEDWGILGLADLPGTACVSSAYRCRRRVRDVPAVERFRRVVVHEVGHTLGLPHCPTYGCFLEDAGGKAETIDRETFLCAVCRERLGWIEAGSGEAP